MLCAICRILEEQTGTFTVREAKQASRLQFTSTGPIIITKYPLCSECILHSDYRKVNREVQKMDKIYENYVI